MSHFYGIISGNRGEATRGGSKDSGYRATAASWQGSVRVYLHHNSATGKDEARVELQPWHGHGTSRVLYDGNVDGSPPVAFVFICQQCGQRIDDGKPCGCGAR